MTWGFAYFVCGILFLWNPHINVIDILPDFIGWFCFAIGLSHLSYLSEDAALARKRAWILCGISLTQLLPMYASLRGDTVFPLAAEPTMVLTYTFVYGLLYIWLGSSVLRKTVNTIETYGLLHGAGITTRGATSLKRMVIVFFIFRYACSILPELVYLRSTEYLGNIIYGVVYDIRNFRPYLVIIFTLISVIVGAVFLCMALSYLHRVHKDGAFTKVLETLAKERHAEFYANQMRSQFTTTQGVFLCSAVFFGCFTIEYIDILPDFIGVIAAMIALLLLSRFAPFKKSVYAFGTLACIVTVPYWFFRTSYMASFATLPYPFIRICKYCLTPSHPDVTEALRAAFTSQWWLCLATLAKAVVLMLFMRYIIQAIEKLDTLSASDGITVYDSMTKRLMRDERQAYVRAPQDVFIWFGIHLAMDVLSMTPPLAFSATPLYVIRIGVFIIFLVKLSSYLTKKKTMLYYHYAYNLEK